MREIPPDRTTPLHFNETERREVREARKAWAREMRALDRNVLAGLVTEARAAKEGVRPGPRRASDPNTPLRRVAAVTGVGLSVLPDRAPRRSLTFGSTRQYVRVSAKKPFRAETLRFKVPAPSMKHIISGSLFGAKWMEGERRWRVIPQSGFNDRLGYCFVQISDPGLYTAIGLPRDPRILATLGLLSALPPGIPIDADGEFLPSICGLILCAPPGSTGAGFSGVLDGIEGFDPSIPGFGFVPADFAGGPPGSNICDLCLGGTSLPELDLYDTFGLIPGGSFSTVPQAWPKPCETWENVGPDNVSGRITKIAFHPTDPQTVLAGSAAGGVFKSDNGGTFWTPKWERQGSLAIGGLAVAPSDGKIVYAATGEWDTNVSAIYVMYPGAGVYRSDDAGETWRRLTPIASTETHAVAVDPVDSNRVLVAGNQALHRSRDGGATWDVRPGMTDGVFDGTISDVAIDSANPSVVYMAVHGGAAGGLYKSTDKGDNWTRLSSGVPTGGSVDGPKIALGRNGAHGTHFVLVKTSNQIFTSVDGGTTFAAATDPGFQPGQSRYMNIVAVDPRNESVLFAGDYQVFRSTDGGVTWTNVSTLASARKNRIHEDVHDIVFDPSNPDHMFVATDGGLYESKDNGVNWIALSGAGGVPADPIVSSGLTTLQCWTVAVSQSNPLAVACTSHDNYSYQWIGGHSVNDLNYSFRGEGGWVEYDPKNRAVIYTDNWWSNIVKTTNGDQFWQNQVWTDLGIDTSNLNAETFRIAWNNTSRLLAIDRTANAVVRSADGGLTWTTVLAPAGEEITAIQFAPSDDLHAYAGSLGGRVWHSSDNGATWTELVRGSLPAARIHDIEVDWTDPTRVFLAFGTRGALGGVGYRPLWRGSVGSGTQASWFDVSGSTAPMSLPDLGLTGVAIDPVVLDTLYVSNIAGVYRSTDGGVSWHPFDEGLPNVFVSDLDIRKIDRTLWVSTMGRGVFRRHL